MEFLEKNIEWLKEKLEAFDGSYGLLSSAPRSQYG